MIWNNKLSDIVENQVIITENIWIFFNLQITYFAKKWESSLWTINDCYALRKHYSCEKHEKIKSKTLFHRNINIMKKF
jgi:hypothetical protein